MRASTRPFSISCFRAACTDEMTLSRTIELLPQLRGSPQYAEREKCGIHHRLGAVREIHEIGRRRIYRSSDGRSCELRVMPRGVISGLEPRSDTGQQTSQRFQVRILPPVRSVTV